jgi:glycerol kinase
MILALDQGTTSSRAIVFDTKAQAMASAQEEFAQIYPQSGWVEHNPQDIWDSQLATAKAAIAKAGILAKDIKAIGITNQRETTVVWEAATGAPIYNAIVWQDRRTASICEKMKADGLADYVRQTTGLVIDAYFSATKLAWILDNVPHARARAEAGELRFGTIDTWLIWKLTGGRVFATDASNASRTMLFDINLGAWDEKLLQYFGIPRGILPGVLSSDSFYGATTPELFGVAIDIAGVSGDQQAALFGQRCLEVGSAKNTYGTGCFMLMNIGDKPTFSKNGLLTTIAWRLGDKITYALEGSVFVAGAAIQWLRDEAQMLDNAAESEEIAMSVADNGGVYLVPAFTGLGAPYWDMYARGAIFGLSRGSSKAHIVRAALESLAYQTRDVLQLMQAEAATPLQTLRVDGGASANNFLMQFQADMLQRPVQRPTITETTALGAACLAGLAVGLWSLEQLKDQWQEERHFAPQMAVEKAEKHYSRWKKAVQRAQHWEEEF